MSIIRYVSTTGSDSNDGTAPSGSGVGPWLTLQKLMTSLTGPGDFGFIRGGTYTENINYNNYGGTAPSGSSGSPITISAYPNETVTISGRVVLANQSIAYVTFQSLTINNGFAQENGIGDNNGGGGIVIQYITFDDCIVTNNGQNGYGGSGSHMVFSNCVFHNNGDNLSGDNTAEHNFYVSGNDGTIDTCEIYNAGSLGITMYPAPERWRIVNNLVYNNGIGNSSPGTLAPGNIQMGGYTHFVANNICYYTTGYTGGRANGIQVGANAHDCEIYHNSCYGNTTGIYNYPSSTGSIIKNNVCFGNDTDYVNDGSVASEDYNDFEDATGSGAHNLHVNPGWPSPGIGDFSITTSSLVYAACPRLALVMTDFDGNTRPNPASMGALEPPAGPPPVAGNGTYSQVTLGSLPDNPTHFIGPTCRNNMLLDGSRSYYAVQLSREGSVYHMSLVKILSGVYVFIDYNDGETFTSGDTLRLEVTGSTTVVLSVKKNGVEILASTDTSLTADAGYGLAGGGALDALALGWEAGNINSDVAAQVVQDTFTTGSTAALAPVNGWTQQAPSDGLIYYTGTGAVAGGPYASLDAVVYWTGITASVDVILGVGGGG